MKVHVNEDLSWHGISARADWRAYHVVSDRTEARYHNSPDCPQGATIADSDIREGTDGRQLCDQCRNREKPAH
jgi:hypothetical protein